VVHRYCPGFSGVGGHALLGSEMFWDIGLFRRADGNSRGRYFHAVTDISVSGLRKIDEAKDGERTLILVGADLRVRPDRKGVVTLARESFAKL
jgi:hypothetical protein